MTIPLYAEYARSLAERIVRPSAAARDRARCWQPEVFAGLAEAAREAAEPTPTGPAPSQPTLTGRTLTGPLVPRALGGSGLSAAETFDLLEGLGEGGRDPGLALALAVHAVLVTGLLRAFGTERQQRRYLPRMASGEWIGALSLQQTSGAAHTPTVTARAAWDRPGWILEGTLDLVAPGAAARHFLLIAEHKGGDRTAFVVDRETTGLSVLDGGPAAMPTCAWARVELEHCVVGPDAVLGTVGKAAVEAEPLLATLDWVFTAAPWLGVMRALTKDAGQNARTRRLFGRPMLSSQSTRFALADLVTRRELAEGLLRQAATTLDLAGHPELAGAASARLFAGQTVLEVAAAAARLAGNDDVDGLTARAYRDALFFAEGGGGTEVLRSVIADRMLAIH
jgi:alkylation response protein AidB-like acyl-CoA dehydrogenase